MKYLRLLFLLCVPVLFQACGRLKVAEFASDTTPNTILVTTTTTQIGVTTTTVPNTTTTTTISTSRPEKWPQLVPNKIVLGTKKVLVLQARHATNANIYSDTQIRSLSSQALEILQNATFGRLQLQLVQAGPVSIQGTCGHEVVNEFYNTQLDYLTAHPELGQVSEYLGVVLIVPPATCGNAGGASNGFSIYLHETSNQTQFVKTLAHELGHNLSLGHSGMLDCDSDYLTQHCRYTDYADETSIMGHWNSLQQFLTSQLASFGHLSDANLIQPTQNGVYRVYTRGTSPSANLPLMLRVPTPYGPFGLLGAGRSFLSLEYLPSVAGADPHSYYRGVQIRHYGEAGGSALIRRNAEIVNLRNVGDTFTEPEFGHSFSLRAIGSNYVDIQYEKIQERVPFIQSEIVSVHSCSALTVDIRLQEDVVAPPDLRWVNLFGPRNPKPAQSVERLTPRHYRFRIQYPEINLRNEELFTFSISNHLHWFLVQRPNCVF